MSDVLANLSPRSVWGHFAALAAIPRPSGHEERAAGAQRGPTVVSERYTEPEPCGRTVAHDDNFRSNDIRLRPVYQGDVLREVRPVQARVETNWDESPRGRGSNAEALHAEANLE